MGSMYKANDPAAYEQSMGRWSRRLARLLLDFARIEAPERVLDVGCGTGSRVRQAGAVDGRKNLWEIAR